MAKNKKKEPRVAAVDSITVLKRDLRKTVWWSAVSVGIVAILAFIGRSIF